MSWSTSASGQREVALEQLRKYIDGIPAMNMNGHSAKDATELTKTACDLIEVAGEKQNISVSAYGHRNSDGSGTAALSLSYSATEPQVEQPAKSSAEIVREQSGGEVPKSSR